MVDTLLPWILFHAAIMICLSIDLLFNQRKGHLNTFKNSILWSCFWIGIALLFNGVVYFFYGKEAALNFLVGYLIEESLSIDNVFVFILIFTYFQISEIAKHKILFWGIISAFFMRALLFLEAFSSFIMLNG